MHGHGGQFPGPRACLEPPDDKEKRPLGRGCPGSVGHARKKSFISIDRSWFSRALPNSR
ncbi:hypothetical protein ASZ90_001840 [hydrocarbon metagenome]|uniref:Uncharacterized protein n=1 Tax=hydrocarbon metagenome TaxID=938273 RepID=A0A0W8G579_9ZZZZ